MKKQQRKKEAGFIISAELILIATILVIGLIVGMVAIRDATTAEMHDVAEAIGSLDQSYVFYGVQDAAQLSQVAGSAWVDTVDTTAGDQQVIIYNVAVTPDEGDGLPGVVFP